MGHQAITHHRFGNINKKSFFRTLVIPGIIGAVAGATLAYFGQEYAKWVRIPLSFYTILPGLLYYQKKAFGKKEYGNKSETRWLAGSGRAVFTDAFCRWWMGRAGYRNIALQKKKSTVCYRFLFCPC